MKATTETTAALKENLHHGVQLLKTLRDEMRVEVHLAGMEAKQRWEKLEPRFAEAELLLAKASQTSHQVLSELSDAMKVWRASAAGEKKGSA